MGGSSLGHCGAGLQEAISGARGGPVYPISALHHTPLHQHWLHFSHCHYQPPCKDAPQNGLIHKKQVEVEEKRNPILPADKYYAGCNWRIVNNISPHYY